jgi:hypothetical protein
MKECIDSLKPFLFWPMPYSKTVKQLMVRLKQEILAPGSSMLERIALETRVPELLNYAEDIRHPIQR